MTPSEIDWTILRRPLLVLVTSLVVTAAFAGGAYYYHEGVSKAHQSESRRLASARGRYLTLDDEKRLIQEFYPQFEELAKQGRIGEEHRLDWIETLRQAAADIKLPSLKYALGSQREYEPDFPLETGRFTVYASEMTLDIGLLHEEDLPRFLNELARRAAGMFSVASCRLRPSEDAYQTNPAEPNLDAQCRLRWYVVKLREEEPAGGERRRTRRSA